MYRLTRPQMWFAVVFVRASPLLAVLAWSRHEAVSWGIWGAALCASLLLQGIFFFVERRCSSPEMPYHRGLLIVSASVSIGWMYFDTLLVLAAVTSAQLVSCAFALMPNAPARYLGLAHWFQRNRVER
jgi:hypothetical protein